MDTTTETPAAPVPELSIDEIVAQELSAAEGSGDTVVQEEAPKTDEQGGSDASGAHTADDAGSTPAPATETTEAPADDVSAARARKMLAAVEEREAALKEREGQSSADLLGELLKNPKAFLAKHGKSIDDVIDASIAEGKAPEPATEDDRVTALERRIAAAEKAEQDRIAAAKNAEADRAIAARKTEIHGEVARSTKFPLINETKRQTAVTDFMVEYHSIHGKAIPWEKAAELVEKDLGGLGIAAAKKLGWQAPPEKTEAKDRPGTVSISGDQRTAAPTTGDEPEDPHKLMAYLVKQAGLAG